MLCRITLFLLSVSLFAQVPFTQFVVFGDSLSDNGNFYVGTSLLGAPQPGPPLYATGEYTDGTNSVPSTSAPLGLWIEQLAAIMNLPSPQPYAKGGTNYAVASAQTGTNPAFSPTTPSVPYLTNQLNLFLSANRTLPVKTLYTFWGGGNDILSGVDPAIAVSNVQGNIATLATAGAKYFFWANQPPLGELPENINTSNRSTLDAASVTYNNAWTNAIAQLKTAHPGITIVAFDAYSEFLSITQNPSLYGFTNVTSPAQGLTNINPNTYFFWDTLHPTTAVDAYVANFAYNAIESAFGGPSSCSYAVSIGGQAFTSQGGNGIISLTTGPGCPWSVGALPAGVSLTSAGSGSGPGTVTFQVFPNGGGDFSGSFTIAGQTFTVEQAAASIPGLTPAGSLGQVTSEGTWDFSLDAINVGSSAATARFTFTDNNGNPLAMPLTFPQSPSAAGPELASTLDRTISSNAQIVMESTGPDSVAALVGSGQLLSNGNVSGFGIFSDPKLGWNAVVPLETRNASRYILAFDNTGTLTTGVAVANLAGAGANIQVIIRDDTGVQIGNPIIALVAQGHRSFMLNDPQLGFPVTTNKRGTIEFDTPPGGQISVLGLRAYGTVALTTLPVLADVGAGGGSITHATYNGGFTSTFYIVNTGTSSAPFTLSFLDESGNPLSVPLSLPQSGTTTTTSALTQTLAAGAMLVVQTQANDAAAAVVGSAQLTTTGNISAFEVFRWTTFNQEASVPLETRTPNSFVLVFDDTNGLTTGVALANLALTAANITVKLYDDAGTLLQTTTINLPARGHTSFLLPSNFTTTANKRGMAEFVVPSGGQISVVGLRAKADGTLTTVPILTK